MQVIAKLSMILVDCLKKQSITEKIGKFSFFISNASQLKYLPWNNFTVATAQQNY